MKFQNEIKLASVAYFSIMKLMSLHWQQQHVCSQDTLHSESHGTYQLWTCEELYVTLYYSYVLNNYEVGNL